MTDDQTQSLHDDIAYMRAMAQEGRNAPLLSGPIMVAAGIIFGTASLVQWAIQTGMVDVSPWAQLWVWLAAGAAKPPFFLPCKIRIQAQALETRLKASGLD